MRPSRAFAGLLISVEHVTRVFEGRLKGGRETSRTPSCAAVLRPLCGPLAVYESVEYYRQTVEPVLEVRCEASWQGGSRAAYVQVV